MSIIEQFINFIVELFKSVSHGYLFFGSAWDIVRYALDIILVTVLFYWVLVFIQQSRAWQLIKGILLIVGLVMICGLMGLEMVGFVFNRLLYVFAFLFIVIFQPELRRALETVGLKSFGSFRNLFSSNDVGEKTQLASLIHEIGTACEEMASTYTGALILIERNTSLDEFLRQENVVEFDSTVTNSVLQSIFYKGSPMHDGGLLIRNGRIVAARCHVPLSETMHTLDRTGTRHRAAVGASEIGDTIAVVVSEERGKISIAINGRLYEMRDKSELEANLAYLLGINEIKSEKRGFSKLFSSKNKKSIKDKKANASEKNADAATPVTKANGANSGKLQLKTMEADKKSKSGRINAGNKVAIIIISFVLSFLLWTYIQVNNNPVITRTITVPVSYDIASIPNNMQVSYPIDTVEVELVGRQNTISSLNVSDVVAYIDYSQATDAGVVELPVVVESTDRNIYFRVERQVPETITVAVYSQSEAN